jgi:RND family efflux transporter MFP subunit
MDLERKETLAAEFRPFQIIDVHAKVAGYLKKIYVDVGDRVKEGQELALLEIPELADEITRAKATSSRSTAEVQRQREELARALAAHEATHLTYTRLQGVAKTRPNLIAQQEIDDAMAKDQVAEAQVSAARAALAESQQAVAVSQADVAKTETMNSYARITAPFSGVITKRYADTGAMIPAGTATTSNGLPLVQLSENSLLRLVLPVPEADVPKVHLGQTVKVRVKALDRVFSGTVTRFADTVNMATRTMDTQVDVPNPNLLLILGMYAEAELTLEKRPNAVSIPLEAVNGQGTNAVSAYVVDADHKIKVCPIKIGMETAERAEVLSGLSENDLVVIGNRGQLTAGQIVEAKVTGQKAAN